MQKDNGRIVRQCRNTFGRYSTARETHSILWDERYSTSNNSITGQITKETSDKWAIRRFAHCVRRGVLTIVGWRETQGMKGIQSERRTVTIEDQGEKKLFCVCAVLLLDL